jgi:hypothetical protein
VALNSLLYSQGNLQFNQVLSYSGSLSCNTNYCGQISTSTYTVPPGKIWKIESVGYNCSAVSSYRSYPFLIINGVACFGGLTSNSNTAIITGNLINSPIWLTSGDILKYGMDSNSATGGQMSISIHFSIIEFNIIP